MPERVDLGDDLGALVDLVTGGVAECVGLGVDRDAGDRVRVAVRGVGARVLLEGP
ncbi:hypothetical protein [Streptomyces kronopolitis]|uniref:hypothetical protein n=1 Tax=Streptomyces kronopolitis TaxID=1612435 RepID=UPI003F4E2737